MSDLYNLQKFLYDYNLLIKEYDLNLYTKINQNTNYKLMTIFEKYFSITNTKNLNSIAFTNIMELIYRDRRLLFINDVYDDIMIIYKQGINDYVYYELSKYYNTIIKKRKNNFIVKSLNDIFELVLSISIEYESKFNHKLKWEIIDKLNPIYQIENKWLIIYESLLIGEEYDKLLNKIKNLVKELSIHNNISSNDDSLNEDDIFEILCVTVDVKEKTYITQICYIIDLHKTSLFAKEKFYEIVIRFFTLFKADK